jgi:hypothetical protein
MFKLPNADSYSTKAIFVKVAQVVKGVGEVVGIIVKEYPSESFDPTNPLGNVNSAARDSSSSSYQL